MKKGKIIYISIDNYNNKNVIIIMIKIQFFFVLTFERNIYRYILYIYIYNMLMHISQLIAPIFLLFIIPNYESIIQYII